MPRAAAHKAADSRAKRDFSDLKFDGVPQDFSINIQSYDKDLESQQEHPPLGWCTVAL